MIDKLKAAMEQTVVGPRQPYGSGCVQAAVHMLLPGEHCAWPWDHVVKPPRRDPLMAAIGFLMVEVENRRQQIRDELMRAGYVGTTRTSSDRETWEKRGYLPVVVGIDYIEIGEALLDMQFDDKSILPQWTLMSHSDAHELWQRGEQLIFATKERDCWVATTNARDDLARGASCLECVELMKKKIG